MALEENTSVEQSKPLHGANPDSPTSQFGILDLILITTGVALAVATTNWWHRSSGSQSLPIAYLMYWLTSGFTLAAFFVMVKNQIAGIKGLIRQPGCILLLKSGVAGLLYVACQAVQYSIFEDDLDIEQPLSMSVIWYLGTILAIYLVAASILIVGMLWVPLRWRVFFFFLIGVNLIRAISTSTFFFNGGPSFYFYASIQTVGNLLTVIAVVSCVVCLVIDHRNKRRYSWLHWIGIWLFFVSYCATPILNLVLVRFFTVEQMYGS